MKRPGQFFIVAILALWTLVTTAAADTVKMKDGTIYDGTIQTETTTALSIEVANAAGTIFRTVEVDKANVAEIIRTTAEQRAILDMEATYKQLLKYQLDPVSSQPLPYYNQVISNVFFKYLDKYPGSPHEADVTSRVNIWTEEREKVAAGQGRIGTEWMSAAEVPKKLEEAKVMAVLDKCNKLTARGRFEDSINELLTVPNLTRRKDLVEMAKRAYADTSRLWIESLERQREPLNHDIADLERRLQRLRADRDQSEGKMKESSLNGADVNNRRIGQESNYAQYQMMYYSLRTQCENADREILSRKEQLGRLESSIIKVKTMAATGNALVGPNEAPITVKTVVVTNDVVKQAPAPEPEVQSSPDVLIQVADYFKRYWVIGLVAFVLIAWGCTRAFS